MIKVRSKNNEVSIMSDNKPSKRIEYIVKSLASLQLLLLESEDNDNLRATIDILKNTTSDIKSVYDVTKKVRRVGNAFD